MENKSDKENKQTGYILFIIKQERKTCSQIKTQIFKITKLKMLSHHLPNKDYTNEHRIKNWLKYYFKSVLILKSILCNRIVTPFLMLFCTNIFIQNVLSWMHSTLPNLTTCTLQFLSKIVTALIHRLSA